MSTIRINNKTYSGNNITVNNNKVYIDGILQEQGDNERNITIVVEGDVEKLQVDVCDKMEIKGNVTGSVQTSSGDVNCGNISGSVSTMSGNVMCDDIGGTVSTMSGDVKCKSHK